MAIVAAIVVPRIQKRPQKLSAVSPIHFIAALVNRARGLAEKRSANVDPFIDGYFEGIG
jgi:hypothetical protein